MADFVGNPSINFVEAKGKNRLTEVSDLRFWMISEATFRPNEPIDMTAWFAKRDKDGLIWKLRGLKGC